MFTKGRYLAENDVWKNIVVSVGIIIGSICAIVVSFLKHLPWMIAVFIENNNNISKISQGDLVFGFHENLDLFLFATASFIGLILLFFGIRFFHNPQNSSTKKQ